MNCDPPEAFPSDYDRCPERFRLARQVLLEQCLAKDVHERVADRLFAEGLTPVLDVGCGAGELGRHLPEGASVGVDNSPVMLARAPGPAITAEATALPFAEASFASVALPYVLYYLPGPSRALAEAYRALRPGGMIAVAAPSRHDSPELAHALPRTPLTFDAERADEALEELFVDIEVERWDAPC